MSDDKSSEANEPKTAPSTETNPQKSWGDGNKTLRVAVNNTREN